MIYAFGPYRLDTDRLELCCGEKAIPVEPQVFEVLRCLVENLDRVVSKEELIERVWEGRFIADATLSARISSARRAVGDSGRDQAVIRTIAKRGFRFVADVDTEPATLIEPTGNENGHARQSGADPSTPTATRPILGDSGLRRSARSTSRAACRSTGSRAIRHCGRIWCREG